MQINLLGGVGAVTDRGEPVDVGPPKCQAVLAALALSAGSAVPAWRLVELVWGEDPPRTAGRTLQSYVVRLRRSLGAGSIVRVGAAYRLEVAADSVDAVRFQRLVDAGDIDAALAEWTGFPLAGLAVPGLAATVDGLVEQWLAAVEAELENRIETDPAAAVARLTELTARYPFREGLWASLMTALYRVGRQADALAAYRTARRNLVEQLGVEPGPRLRELEALVLGHDQRLSAAQDGRPGNLPQRPGRLIGRDEDLQIIEDALAAYPVVTLVGPGGIGKTRLAVAAARRAVAEDGAWLVDLTEISSSSDVPRAVAGPLGVKETSGLTLGQSIVADLRSRRALLVLDNCEHVIDGAAELAQAVAEGCPDMQVLATSREGLGLGHGHERLIAVAPLEPAGPAVELFNERAMAVSRIFDPLASRRDAEEICRRLDGLPLAIELAAARTTSLGTADLLARLDDQLRLLVGGQRTGAERHRTLRAAIQWSYDLLDPPERLLLQRLSVFTGPFDRAAADAAPDVDDLLRDLVERSMLVVQSGPFGQRFRFLEPIRQYAAEQLARTGHTGLAAVRHAQWCQDRVTQIHRLLAGPAEADGVARLNELWPNLRAAVDWACTTGDRALAYALVRPVVAEIPFRSRTEIGDWLERILAITPPDDTELVVFGLTWAGQRYKVSQNRAGYEHLVGRYGEPDHPLIHHVRACVYDDFATIGQWAPASLAELRRRGEHDLAEQIEVDIGAALTFGGEYPDGEALIAKLADRYRAQGPPTLVNWCLMLLGYSAAFQGRQDRAEQLFDEAVGVEVPAGTHSPNKTVEARAVFRRGDRVRAFAILRSHVDDLLNTGNVHGAWVASIEFVAMMATVGRLADAARILCYLDATGLLNKPVWETQVAEARGRIAGAVPDPDLDDRQALEYMRRTLDQAARG